MLAVGYTRDEYWTAAALVHLVRMYYVDFIDRRRQLDEIAEWITTFMRVPVAEGEL